MEDFVIFSGNDHVIHVDTEPSLCNLFLKNVVHHGLECGRGVGQAEEHNCWLKESFAGFEGSFIFVAFFYTDIVISPVNVEFGEETFLCQIVNEFRNKGKWIFVGNCPFVQISVVLYGVEFAIFLLD